MKATSILLLAMIFLQSTAYANPEGKSTESEIAVSPKQESKFSVNIEGVPVLLSGFGMNAGYKLNPQIEAGIFGRFFKMDTDKENAGLIGTQFEVKMSGVRANYFLNSASSNGLYFAAALGIVSVKATTRYKGLGIIADGEESGTASQTLTHGLIGYQLMGADISENSKFQVRMGIGYGSGGAYEYSIAKSNPEIKSGVTLEVDAGLAF